jgi:carbon starvation protein
MNVLWICIVTVGIFFLGYRYYGNLAAKLYGINPKRKTPAFENYDGVDYVPARHWFFLFGHHFAAIAGAAPIIGPVIAVAVWGWGPALIWVLLGSIFMGAMHDYGALICSVRHRGMSIADIAGGLISRRTRLLFLLFIWLALILLVAVFVFFSAKTYVEDPKIVVPSLGLIPIALLVGFMLYRWKASQVGTTLLGLLLMVALTVAGNYMAVDLGDDALNIWIMVLLIYCFCASVTPVQILLQPRDYLCGLILVAGIIFGYGGLVVSHPSSSIAPFVAWNTSLGMLWPMLFVTIACGAISGFHALIASGTTSKQLPNERHAKKIGYGSMLMEGIVAALAIFTIIGGIKNHAILSKMIAQDGPGPIAAFAQGYRVITSPFFGDFGGTVAVVILNSFILSSLDAGTRIGRYILQELFGIKNRYLSTFIIVLLSGCLALSGKWTQIWPIFGASNQLIAALALIVLTAWLLSRGRSIYYTSIPAIFMLFTTIGALVYKILQFSVSKEYPLMVIGFVLMILAMVVFLEAIIMVKRGIGTNAGERIAEGKYPN